MSRKQKQTLASTLVGVLLVLILYLAASHGLLPSGPAGQEGGLTAAPAAPTATPEPTARPPLSEDPAEAEKQLLVYYFDVGQGDSMLVRSPKGVTPRGEIEYRNMLIDTGEYQYADGLTDMLHSLGVETIDSFVITHPHTDHMGCAARIVQRFEIGAIYMPRVPDDKAPTTSAYEALLNAVEKKGLSIVSLNQDTLADGEVRLPDSLADMQIFAPRPDADWDGMNNWSAVFRLEYGETSFLFTGDAERDVLDQVREDAETFGWELNSTVLKCSHHGSNDGNPSKWLKAVSPEFAVISCGANNDYGHPHREPLERLENLNTTVYRTDLDGTVLAVSDGKTITWQTGLPSVRGKN